MSSWITIATYLDRPIAEIAKSLLESSGIPVQLKADDMGGNRPELGHGPGVKLMVEQQDEMEAREILRVTEDRSQIDCEPARTNYFLRAQALCLLSFVCPLIPNLVSLYLMLRYRQFMILEKSGNRYAFLLLFNSFLILAFGLIAIIQWAL